MDGFFQNIRANFLEILKLLEISEFLECLIFFGNFGVPGTLLKFWKYRKLGARILEFFELILGGLIVTHPMTDHALRLT